ncbi:MAG: flagellar biosynthetic protein FliO [Thermodesulfobacteriota bacterium]
MTDINLLSAGFKAIAMLCIVLGMVILVLYLMKRFLFSRVATEGNIFMKKLSSMHLSPKQRIEVVEIMGEKIVLGITPGSINFLTKLSDFPPRDKGVQGGRQDYEIKE